MLMLDHQTVWSVAAESSGGDGQMLSGMRLDNAVQYPYHYINPPSYQHWENMPYS